MPLLLLARYNTDAGRWDDALQLLARARARRVQAYGEASPPVSAIDNRLGIVYLAQGRLDDAERQFRSVAAASDARGARFGSIGDQARLNLVLLQIERGRFDGVAGTLEAMFDRLAALPEAERQPLNEFAVSTRMGRLRLAQGDPARALPHLQRAVAVIARMHHADSPLLAVARARLAMCFVALGQPQRAAELVAQAEAALRAQPQVGRQFSAPVAQARAALTR